MTDLYLARLPAGQDPDDVINTDPEHWRRLTAAPPGSIILCFDSDWAGQQAAMRGIDKYLNVKYADGQDLHHNGTWVMDGEAYTDFQNTLLDLGIGLHVPKPKDKENSWWVDPASIRGWPVPRLVAALEAWQTTIAHAYLFGNSYLIKYVIPHADQRIAELRKELERRATPKLRIETAPKDVKGYWDHKKVRELVDPFDIYAQLIPDLEPLNGEFLRSACPLHTHKGKPLQGKKGSFSVARESGAFKCWNCGKEGSMFDFVSLLENLPFAEAVNRVAELGNL